MQTVSKQYQPNAKWNKTEFKNRNQCHILARRTNNSTIRDFKMQTVDVPLHIMLLCDVCWWNAGGIFKSMPERWRSRCSQSGWLQGMLWPHAQKCSGYSETNDQRRERERIISERMEQKLLIAAKGKNKNKQRCKGKFWTLNSSKNNNTNADSMTQKRPWGATLRLWDSTDTSTGAPAPPTHWLNTFPCSILGSTHSVLEKDRRSFKTLEIIIKKKTLWPSFSPENGNPGFFF